MSDAYVEAYGKNLDEAFDNAARALIDTMVPIRDVRRKFTEPIEVEGHDLQSLLYNWLEAVLIKVTSEAKVYSSFDVKVRKTDEGYALVASAKGEELDVRRHKPKVEVKAITYHLMEIRREDDQVILRFLLDL